MYELRSILLDIKYYDMLLRGLEKYATPINHYFLILVPIPKNGIVYENLNAMDKVNSLFNGVIMEIGKKGLSSIGEKAKGIMPGYDKQIDDVTKGLVANAAPTDPTVKALMSTTDKIRKGEIPSLAEMKDAATALCKAASPDGASVIARAMEASEILQSEVPKMAKGERVDLEKIVRLAISLAKIANPKLS